MEEQIIQSTEAPSVQSDGPVEVVDIQFRAGQKIYFFDPDGAVYQPGDHVIMDTARGAEFGICAGGNHMAASKDVVAPLRKILRRATAQDEKIVAENQKKEKRAWEVCTQKIQNFGLDMQLVSAEVAFDGSKILFYFTADERVDFRELVKFLASVFHTRIELRQIGVRDKAKMVGGLGICGRPFCCASFLDDFQPVSIKMAKTQNLSLNPTKISGTCGRLMCCLKYEQDTYEDLISTSPKMDSFVDTPDGRGTVIEVDLLRQRVKVRMEENPDTVSIFPNGDIAVLRNGKPRKNDPPIPADYAPISGGGKRAPKPEPEEAPLLEPIRFRYSTENVVDAQTSAQSAPAENAESAAPQPRRNRRRNDDRQKRENPNSKRENVSDDRPKRENAPEAKAPAEGQEADPQGEAAESGQAPHSRRYRRPNYRRRRSGKPGGSAPQGESV